jgi:hypothetical protein
MSIEKTVLEKLLKLPVEKQKQALDFVDSLEKKAAAPYCRRSLKGLWADLGTAVSSEDIVEARREMWGGILFSDVIIAEAMPQNLRPA